MKTCSRCNRTLDETCFVKSARYLDGLTQPCKECRREIMRLRLEANPICIMCKKEPHMKGNSYCRTCLRIVNGLPLERVRPNVDRNNKTMCSRCKVKPRAKGGHYCVECKTDMAKESYERLGSKWSRATPAQKQKIVARQFVHWKVEQGQLTKTPCAVCGDENVEAHHHKGYDYEHRMDVIWLCTTHHKEADRKTIG